MFSNKPILAHFGQGENFRRYLFGQSSNRKPTQKKTIDGNFPPVKKGTKNPQTIIKNPKKLIIFLTPLTCH